MILRVGTRESKLAIVQTKIVVSQIKALHPNLEIIIHPMTTTGDKLYDADLSVIGGKGLFLKELEEHLLSGAIDIAVHSLKDFPAAISEDLEIVTYLEREDPFDAFLSDKYESLFDMPAGAVVGTSSSRRAVQIKKMRPDLETAPLRGNVFTRIKKMEDGEVDACVLACAGLNRLGLQSKIKHKFSKEQMLPACGQGIICVESRVDDSEIYNLLKRLNNKESEYVARAERSFTMALNGSCTTPMAAHAVVYMEEVHLDVMYYDQDKNKHLYASTVSGIHNPEKAGEDAAKIIKKAGGLK